MFARNYTLIVLVVLIGISCVLHSGVANSYEVNSDAAESSEYKIISLNPASNTLGSIFQRQGGPLRNRGLQDKIEQHSTTLEPEELITRYLELLDRIESAHIRYGLMGKMADLYLVIAQELLEKEVYAKADEYLVNAASWYVKIVEGYPKAEQNDLIWYQLAKAYDLLGMENESVEALEQLVEQFGNSEYFLESAFRLGEVYYSRANYRKAEIAYQHVIKQSGPEQESYYTNALNMMGWVHFKEGRYEQAFNMFMSLLLIVDAGYSDSIDVSSEADSHKTRFQLREDVIRIICITLSYLKGHESLANAVSEQGKLPFSAELYDALATFYLSKFQYHDAAKTWNAYIFAYPNDRQNFNFSVNIQRAYLHGGLPTEARKAKEIFIKQFGIKSGYWPAQSSSMSELEIKTLLGVYRELAIFHHSEARKSGNEARKSVDLKGLMSDTTRGHFRQASYYYRQFLTLSPEADDSSEITFYLATTQKEQLLFGDASYWFEKVAYELPQSQWAESAAIEAIDCYNQQLTQIDQTRSKNDAEQKKSIWSSKIISLSAYLKRFPTGADRQAVLSDLVQTNFHLGDYDEVIRIVSDIVSNEHSPPIKRLEAASLRAKAQFASTRFQKAEQSFDYALQLLPLNEFSDKWNTELSRQLTDSLAASIYQHALNVRTLSPDKAIDLFFHLFDRVPSSQYDVPARLEMANILKDLKQWIKASQVLVQLRDEYPTYELLHNLSDKLIFLYEQSKQWDLLASELNTQFKLAKSRKEEKEKIVQIAFYYDLAGDHQSAIKHYKIFISRYASSLDEKLSVQQKIAEIYDSQDNIQARNHWLEQIVKLTSRVDRKSGGLLVKNESLTYLGAESALKLAEFHNKQYQQISLKDPLDKNIELKMKQLNKAVEAYGITANYGFSSLVNQSTYKTGALFSGFASAILRSERPQELSAMQREEYDLLLEDQAFPLEEQAITLHELNMSRITESPLDPWVNKSFTSLKRLLPVRYNKHELIPAWVDIE